ncbi:hypothetical protein INR49_023152 [Caranx melampygus]|nr:hypothetical protein INR49_023152 [Caranx melampygus]
MTTGFQQQPMCPQLMSLFWVTAAFALTKPLKMNMVKRIMGRPRQEECSPQDNALGLMHLRRLFSELCHPPRHMTQKEQEEKLYMMLPVFNRVDVMEITWATCAAAVAAAALWSVLLRLECLNEGLLTCRLTTQRWLWLTHWWQNSYHNSKQDHSHCSGAPGSRLQAPGSRLQALGSRLQAPGSRPQAPGSRLQALALGSRFQAPGSRLQAPGSRLQAPGPRPQAPGSRPQAPGPRLEALGSTL